MTSEISIREQSVAESMVASNTVVRRILLPRNSCGVVRRGAAVFALPSESRDSHNLLLLMPFREHTEDEDLTADVAVETSSRRIVITASFVDERGVVVRLPCNVSRKGAVVKFVRIILTAEASGRELARLNLSAFCNSAGVVRDTGAYTATYLAPDDVPISTGAYVLRILLKSETIHSKTFVVTGDEPAVVPTEPAPSSPCAVVAPHPLQSVPIIFSVDPDRDQVDAQFIGLQLVLRAKRGAATTAMATIDEVTQFGAALAASDVDLCAFESTARMVWQMLGRGVTDVSLLVQHKANSVIAFRRHGQRRALKILPCVDGDVELQNLINEQNIRDDIVTFHQSYLLPSERNPQFIGLELEFVRETMADLRRNGSTFHDDSAVVSDALSTQRDAQVVQIVLSLLDILKHLHERGIVHCDVKESNLAVAYDERQSRWRVRLLDVESFRLYADRVDATDATDATDGDASDALARSRPPPGGSASSLSSIRRKTSSNSSSMRFTSAYFPSASCANGESKVPSPLTDIWAVVRILARWLRDKRTALYAAVFKWNCAGLVPQDRDRDIFCMPPPAAGVPEDLPTWKEFADKFGTESCAQKFATELSRLVATSEVEWLKMPHIVSHCVGGFEGDALEYFVALHASPQYECAFGSQGSAPPIDRFEFAAGDVPRQPIVDGSDESVFVAEKSITSAISASLAPPIDVLTRVRRDLAEKRIHENDIVALKFVMPTHTSSEDERIGLRVVVACSKYSDSVVRRLTYERFAAALPPMGPQVDFPAYSGSLGVHCTLITCDGCMVFTLRQKTMSTSAGLWTCGAVETVKLSDATPFAAIRRAILEEIGVRVSEKCRVRITSLMVKPENYQWGFTAYIDLREHCTGNSGDHELSRECTTTSIIERDCFPRAKDSNESRDIVGINCDAASVLNFLRTHQVVLSARACALLALHSLWGTATVDAAVVASRTVPMGVARGAVAVNVVEAADIARSALANLNQLVVALPPSESEEVRLKACVEEMRHLLAITLATLNLDDPVLRARGAIASSVASDVSHAPNATQLAAAETGSTSSLGGGLRELDSTPTD